MNLLPLSWFDWAVLDKILDASILHKKPRFLNPPVFQVLWMEFVAWVMLSNVLLRFWKERLKEGFLNIRKFSGFVGGAHGRVWDAVIWAGDVAKAGLYVVCRSFILALCSTYCCEKCHCINLDKSEASALGQWHTSQILLGQWHTSQISLLQVWWLTIWLRSPNIDTWAKAQHNNRNGPSSLGRHGQCDMAMQ